MKNDLHLYIGSREVELSTDPSILYTYDVDDFTNPTAVKNSFSKSITIKSSPNNNKIFGHFWNVERRVVDGGQNAGIYFNASKKAPFQIIVNGDIYESGYVKLEKVTAVGDDITYEVGLFGGLGDFFYNLSYNDGTGNKLTLADLDYYTGGDDEFDFTASASTIMDAWDSLENESDDMYQHINFMPAYNGNPSDFSTDKVIINLSGTSLPQTDESGFLRPADPHVVANLPQSMSEWEIRDIRSYLQRPCVRMKSIISACCDPNQNGGYEVSLDPDFFTSGHPYYEKTWISRPLMTDLQYSTEEQILTGSTLVGLTTTGDVGSFSYQDLKFDIGEFSNSTPSSIRISASIFINSLNSILNAENNPFLGGLADWVPPSTSFAWFWNKGGDSYHSGWWCLGSLFVQLIALNGDVIVGASDAYNLTTPIKHNGKTYYGNNSRYPDEYKFVPYLNKNINDVLGEFQNDGFHYWGVDTPAEMYFTINGINSPVSSLKMVYWWGATEDKVKKYGRTATFDYEQDSSWIDVGGPDVSWLSFSDPFPMTLGVTSTDFNAVLGASLGRTGTRVTKADLLGGTDSPCDYLLSYCKMFGLYFRKEPDENKIYIETRKTFYRRDEIVNINDIIDRSKNMDMNPIIFDTKWYVMAQEADETDFYSDYMASKAIEYGCKVLNTGYEFSTEKKNLYDGSSIRSGIEGLERSKYFSCFNNDKVLRPWMGMGLKYTLKMGTETRDVDVPINTSSMLPLNEGEGMKYYDVFPKLQFHTEDGSPTDGNDCLVFFSGFKSVSSGRSNPLYYYLTDDNVYQTLLNDGTPCWLFTSEDTDYAHRITSFPVFERYLTDMNSGTVKKSLDFGTPQELYIPNYNIQESQNIYSNFWKTYIEDLFDPDTKVMTCYVLINDKVGSKWLRRFYWYDNAIWRIKSVKDFNMCDSRPTQVEFVKVQDIGDYNSITQSKGTTIILTADKYRVDENGGQVILHVEIDTGGDWWISATDGAVLSPISGHGSGNVSVTIPASSEDYVKGWYFTASSDDGASSRVTIQQGYEGESDFTPSPSDIIIPSSGGSYMIEFIWKNQGSDYIESVDFNEGDSYLQFSSDTTTYRSENKAVLTFAANTGDTTLSNYCQFISHEGIRHSIGIDQLPPSYDFDATGGTTTAIIHYSPSSTFTNVPDWLSVEEVDDGVYVITAKDNVWSTENVAEVTITNQAGSSASVIINQGTNGGASASDTGVTPTNLYFDATDAGTKFVTINLKESWWADGTDVFWTLSQDAGDAGVNIVGVTASDNAGSGRSGVINIHTSGDTIPINVIQMGVDEVESMTTDPSAVTITSVATSQTITIIYHGRNGYALAPSVPNGVTATPITWNGETGTTIVTIPANTTTSVRTLTISFNGRVASASTIFTQGAGDKSASVDDDGVVFNFSGGTNDNGVDANTPWTATTNDSWITFSPTSGASGYTGLSISADTNDSFASRTGYIYINAIEDDSLLATIVVSQGGKQEILSVTPSVIYFDTAGGTATFTITSNVNWTIN